MYLLVVILAGISFSISEVVANFYRRSPFVKSGRKFFNPDERKNAIKFMGVTIHSIPVFNWIAVLLLIAALPLSQIPLFTINFIVGWWQLVVSIVVFVFSFNFSIHKMIKKEEA